MWAYIKENKLQDPKNKQFIKCDEKLSKVSSEDKRQANKINSTFLKFFRSFQPKNSEASAWLNTSRIT